MTESKIKLSPTHPVASHTMRQAGIIPYPRHYWGITEHGETRFSGTFRQCWDKLVADFGNNTLAGLTGSGIRISRIK